MKDARGKGVDLFNIQRYYMATGRSRKREKKEAVVTLGKKASKTSPAEAVHDVNEKEGSARGLECQNNKWKRNRSSKDTAA